MADVDLFGGVRHFRRRADGEEQRVTALELFFDLVFVFAITQLSHLLLEHLTLAGAAKTVFLLLVVWWGWNYTSWMTNFMDPESVPVRVALLVAALVSLLMAVAIPEAFGARAPLFAVAYVALQAGRNAFVWLLSPRGTAFRNNFACILTWSLASGALYVAGGFLPADARVAVWGAALAVDIAGPALLFRVPWLARVSTRDWAVDPRHFAERFQLFVLIALGESIVVTGATASQYEMDPARATAIGVAFVGSAALWWLYFSYVAAISTRRLDMAADPGRLARDAYTYGHLPIVAGVIVTAVGDELVIAHPGAGLGAAELAAVAAGPVLYLGGHLLFRLMMAGSASGKRATAAAAVVAGAALGAWIPALGVAALVAASLVGLIVWETAAAHRRRARGLPSPIERLEALAGSERRGETGV